MIKKDINEVLENYNNKVYDNMVSFTIAMSELQNIVAYPKLQVEEYVDAEEEAQIVVQDDLTLKGDEQKEIITNMSFCDIDFVDDTMLTSYIPGIGVVKLTCEYDENVGMRFYIKRVILKCDYRNIGLDGKMVKKYKTYPPIETVTLEQGTVIGVTFNLDIKKEVKNSGMMRGRR